MSTTQIDTFQESPIGLLSGTQAEPPSRIKDPISVSGIAIPENTVVQGGADERHFFDETSLEELARQVNAQIEEGVVHIVKNFHEREGQAEADDVIGKLNGVRHAPGVGLLFNGEVTDETIAENIAHGYLEVSPSVFRELGEFDEQRDARAVTETAGFRDLAVVARGQPGVEVAVGSNPSVEALSRSIDALGTDDNGGDPMDIDTTIDIDVDTLQEQLAADQIDEVMGIVGAAHQDAWDSLTDAYVAVEDEEEFGAAASTILENAAETIRENLEPEEEDPDTNELADNEVLLVEG